MPNDKKISALLGILQSSSFFQFRTNYLDNILCKPAEDETCPYLAYTLQTLKTAALSSCDNGIKYIALSAWALNEVDTGSKLSQDDICTSFIQAVDSYTENRLHRAKLYGQLRGTAYTTDTLKETLDPLIHQAINDTQLDEECIEDWIDAVNACNGRYKSDILTPEIMQGLAQRFADYLFGNDGGYTPSPTQIVPRAFLDVVNAKLIVADPSEIYGCTTWLEMARDWSELYAASNMTADLLVQKALNMIEQLETPEDKAEYLETMALCYRDNPFYVAALSYAERQGFTTEFQRGFAAFKPHSPSVS